MPTRTDHDPLTEEIIGAAIEVHRALGPGLLESMYETCLAWELRLRHIAVRQQVPVEVMYKQLRLPNAYRVDLVVEDKVLVEVKAADRLHPLMDAQVLTYLKLTRLSTSVAILLLIPPNQHN